MPGSSDRSRPVAWLRRHRLAAFFLVTFALSWGVPLAAFGVASAVAAVAVVAVTDGRRGVRRYVRRVTAFRGRWPWYAAVFVGVPLAFLASAVVASATGGPALSLDGAWLEPFVVVALLRLTQGPVEEFGWRGFALPLLQRRYSGLVSALVLGLVWGLWHAPALVVSTAEFARGGALLPGLVRLFVSMVATSVVLTVVYNGSEGSVPLAVGFHWLTNLAYPWESTSTVPLAQDVVFALVSALVAATVGRRYLGSERLATDVFVPAEPAAATESPSPAD